MRHRYRSEVLAQLWGHGIQPRATTPPQIVHDFVTDLYRFELRRLRDRLLRHEVEKSDYFALVVEVRRRYPLLSLKARQWVERA